jgi:8-amino-7-oxononanoate synthase
MPSPYHWLHKSLQTLHQADRYRSVKTITQRAGAIAILDGEPVINFASNDYLGLAGDGRLIQAAIAATQEYGTGSTGSRLLSGHRDLHRQLERAIAELKQTEDAIVFSSGYLANLGAITALVGQRDLILADSDNHSSLKNGAKLSGANVLDYQHCNMGELERLLQQYRHQYRRCLIVSDTVFSMEGDRCPLPQLINLAHAYEGMLLVDEAHATGVFGERGAGVVEEMGQSGQELVQVGTLSKALGSLGGYVAGSAALVDFLRNRAATWIYTTALSPADTAAALVAIAIVKSEPLRRQQLWQNAAILRDFLQKFNLFSSQSPILCLGLSSAKEALAMSDHLRSQGIFVPAIRPPTVATSRLRFSVMATHEPQQLEQVAKAVAEFKIFSDGNLRTSTVGTSGDRA